MVKQVFTYSKIKCMEGVSLRFRKGAAEDKVVACVAWRFLSGETAITNPKVARS